VTPVAPPTVLLLHRQPGGAADWDRVVAGVDGRADVLAVEPRRTSGHVH
jgi:hypothetical protein